MRKTYLKKSLYRSLRFIFLAASLIFSTQIIAQNLVLSSGGQTGTSGTNWSTSGTNPVTITTTGAANINTSVITGYLNSGTSVIVVNNSAGSTVNSNITKTTGAAASFTLKDVGYIKVADNITISSSSNALDIILWSDHDLSQSGTVNDFIYCGIGSSFTSNGGKIVMAGGPDNGSNGGVNADGIPDGFAWNGSNDVASGANTIGGVTLGPLGGAGTVISLNSNGGEIILRGSTSNNNSYPGVASQGNLVINAGTGKITMYGKSTTGHGVELTYGAAPNLAISSSSTSVPAIDLKGITTVGGYSGFWASNNATGNILIQSTAASGGGITVEGVANTGYGVFFGTTGSSITTQLLSQTGAIILKGDGGANLSLVLYGDVYTGNRKDATAVQGITPAVTSSTANILIQADDQFQFSATALKNTNFNSTGSLTIEAYTAAYAGTISWTGNTVFGSGFSSITLGESAENYSVTVNNTLNAAGPITAYANNFSLANGIGLTSSTSSNITINAKGNFGTAGTTRRTLSSAGGNINVYADADANGAGQLDIDYTTFNPGTGNITLRGETMAWVTSSTERPYLNGTGSVTFEPSDASFQDINTVWFYFDQDANGMSGLTLGKINNTGNITHDPAAISVAGPISMYGGIVTLNANLTSTANGDIFIKSNTNVNAAGSIAGNASILKTAGTGTLTMQSQDRLNAGTITASGSGMLHVILWSDYDNNNNGGVTTANITTNGGHFWLGGSNSNGGSYTWNGLTVGDGPSVGSVNNNHNAIDFVGTITTNGGDVLVWGGDGYSGGAFGIGVYAGAAINAGSGDITLIADNILFNDLTLTSTGLLSLVPNAGAFGATANWSGAITTGTFNGTNTFDRIVINSFASLGGLTIGLYSGHLSGATPVLQGNSNNITVSLATAIAGPLTLNGAVLTINENLASSTGSNISLYGNTLTIGSGKTISSTGNLIIEPQTNGTTIGIAGGAGTLSLPATYFSTNFSNGFSEIQIGNSNAGAITLGAALTLQDPLQLITSGNLALNETLELGSNNFLFSGNTIVPALNKFVKTNGTGRLRISVSNGSSKLFPIGVTYYNPVTITNNTGSADIFYTTVSTGVYTDGTPTGSLFIAAPRVDLTWNIGNTAASTGAGNVTMDFAWNAANVNGSFIAPKLLHHNGAAWDILGGTPTYDLGAGTLTYTSYSGSFSPFAIGESNFTLPVTWLSFTGKAIGKTVVLDWATASEQNNHHFDIERSSDGMHFTSIGKVNASANPGTNNQYRFTDLNPLNGAAYYRLRQVDLDGKIHYSIIISITTFEANGFSIYSEPGSGLMTLTIPSSVTGLVDIILFDALGRQLQQQQGVAGQQLISLRGNPSGGVVYVKVLKQGRVVYTGKLLL